MDKKYCADMIVRYNNKLVLIERFTDPQGYALPGGKLEDGESLEDCARRELKEETGLESKNMTAWRIYDDPARDHRFISVSLVFIVDAYGELHDEPEKTRVFTIDPDSDEFRSYKDRFVFDHYEILDMYLRTCLQSHRI